MSAVRDSLACIDRRLLPPLCALCRTPLRDQEVGACGPCRLDLPGNVPCCPDCAEPLALDPGAAPCARCQARPLPLEKVIAPLRYAFPVDVAIRAIKFRGRLEFVPLFTPVLSAALAAADLEVDTIVPVPLHWFRHGRRGFNQAGELAVPVARALRLPVFRHVARTRRTQPQSGLDATDRRRNLRHAFTVRKSIDAEHALIVDDVMTTGATIAELARCLRRAGVQRVSALVAARAAAAGQAAGANV